MDMPRVSTEMGVIYDMEAKQCEVNLEDYTDIYLDFNGSMAFLNENWTDRLGVAAAAGKMKGVFVMGGVRSDSKPMTMPSIPDVLNRFSRCTIHFVLMLPLLFSADTKISQNHKFCSVCSVHIPLSHMKFLD